MKSKFDGALDRATFALCLAGGFTMGHWVSLPNGLAVVWASFIGYTIPVIYYWRKG
jgi:hypothetical protein